MARECKVKIWAGTRKGVFAFSSSDRKKWSAEGPFFAGEEVHHVAQDPRDPQRHYAAVGNAWVGPHLHASTDNGKTWKLSENGLAVKDIADATTLKRIWHIAPGAEDEPGVVYAGADPGVLFRSADHGVISSPWLSRMPVICSRSSSSPRWRRTSAPGIRSMSWAGNLDCSACRGRCGRSTGRSYSSSCGASCCYGKSR